MINIISLQTIVVAICAENELLYIKTMKSRKSPWQKKRQLQLETEPA